jgi:hypothetical protein
LFSGKDPRAISLDTFPAAGSLPCAIAVARQTTPWSV